MGKFYIVRDCYAPSTAPVNRMKGFLKAFSGCGAKMDVVFFMPDSKRSKADLTPDIQYHYYWKFLPFTQNWLRFPLYLFCYRYLFSLRLKKGDTVLLLGCSNLVSVLTSKKGVRVFHERTEHPEVIKLKFTNLKKYYKASTKLSGVFAISTPIRDFFVRKGVAPQNVHVINMTVDPSRFEGLEKEQVSDYIAYCGTASNNKDGVDELIKAFAIVHKTHPTIKLYIIGATPSKADEAGNQKLISDLGIRDFVVFTGRIPAQQMPQIFPDFLEDGVSALMAEERNPSEFASKICWALEHPEEAAIIGRAGKDVAIQYFNAQIEGVKMFNIMFGTND